MKKGPIIIANWKMKLDLEEARNLATRVVEGIKEMGAGDLPDIVLCPSHTALTEVFKITDSSEAVLGAQDVFWEEKGAYTGEVSCGMLRSLGARYFIIGHSERRQYLGETDEMVNKKVKAVLDSGGVPIVCVGETRAERREGKKDYRVVEQVTKALTGIEFKEGQQVIIAYEPVWVIGVGQAVGVEEVRYMRDLIGYSFLDFSSQEFSQNNLRIIYGGSVDSENIGELMEFGGVDGFLVGTASLDAREFLRMAELMGGGVIR